VGWLLLRRETELLRLPDSRVMIKRLELSPSLPLATGLGWSLLAVETLFVISLPVCSICLSCLCLSLCMPVSCLCLFACLLSACLSFCLSVRPSLSVCLCVCVSDWLCWSRCLSDRFVGLLSVLTGASLSIGGRPALLPHPGKVPQLPQVYSFVERSHFQSP
jgi:hypothetical protein